ncbi:MAG: uroporphyrinogen decarboxylase family protein [Methanomassiliicoccales archaeon]
MTITSFDRVMTAIGQKEPDRVPYFLLLTMHGAKELDMPIRQYFSKAENVVEGQSRMLRRYGHDCIYAFFYAPLEVEAWGGEVIYYEDGPPNTGRPFLTRENIATLEVPEVQSSKPLQKVLGAQRALRERFGNDFPIIGVSISPFSLPVMQMGFEAYLELLLHDKERFWDLMKVNEKFCTEWSNAQLEAGAHAICYFDPVSSSTIVTPEMYRRTGMLVAERTIRSIKGPTATHFASGRCKDILDQVAGTGTAMAGVSMLEDLAELKERAAGRLTLLGNLNGLTMRKWDSEETASQVREAIRKAAPGGGFILSDSHGEIPWQTPTEVLLDIGKAVRKYGTYPIRGL